MIFKIISVVFCAVLLLQGYDAASLRVARDAPTAIKAGQLKLTKFVLGELNNIGKIKMANSKKLVENVLNDPNVLATNTDTMESYLQEFRKFVEHVNNHGDKSLMPYPDGSKLMSEESALMKKYVGNDETEEAEIISAALEEQGIENQLELLVKPIMEYTNRFLVEAEQYLNILVESDAEEKTAFSELIKAIKAETDAKKRGDLIVNYIGSFDISPEEIM